MSTTLCPMSADLLPPTMANLPRDPNRPRFVVPWFVEWIDGKPDFRVADSRKIPQAVRMNLCWLCGKPLGAYKAFVIGPMCAVNRVSAEPPSHLNCAEYAVKVCPFLTEPHMRRNEKNLPVGAVDPAGVMISRNPGAMVIWVAKKYELMRVDNGVLFGLGDPVDLYWFAEGRQATRSEVMASIESGLPILREKTIDDPRPGAIEALDAAIDRAMKLLDACEWPAPRPEAQPDA